MSDPESLRKNYQMDDLIDKIWKLFDPLAPTKLSDVNHTNFERFNRQGFSLAAAELAEQIYLDKHAEVFRSTKYSIQPIEAKNKLLAYLISYANTENYVLVIRGTSPKEWENWKINLYPGCRYFLWIIHLLIIWIPFLYVTTHLIPFPNTAFLFAFLLSIPFMILLSLSKSVIRPLVLSIRHSGFYFAATELIGILPENFGSKNLIIVGHSLGGGVGEAMLSELKKDTTLHGLKKAFFFNKATYQIDGLNPVYRNDAIDCRFSFDPLTLFSILTISPLIKATNLSMRRSWVTSGIQLLSMLIFILGLSFLINLPRSWDSLLEMKVIFIGIGTILAFGVAFIWPLLNAHEMKEIVRALR